MSNNNLYLHDIPFDLFLKYFYSDAYSNDFISDRYEKVLSQVYGEVYDGEYTVVDNGSTKTVHIKRFKNDSLDLNYEKNKKYFFNATKTAAITLVSETLESDLVPIYVVSKYIPYLYSFNKGLTPYKYCAMINGEYFNCIERQDGTNIFLNELNGNNIVKSLDAALDSKNGNPIEYTTIENGYKVSYYKILASDTEIGRIFINSPYTAQIQTDGKLPYIDKYSGSTIPVYFSDENMPKPPIERYHTYMRTLKNTLYNNGQTLNAAPESGLWLVKLSDTEYSVNCIMIRRTIILSSIIKGNNDLTLYAGRYGMANNNFGNKNSIVRLTDSATETFGDALNSYKSSSDGYWSSVLDTAYDPDGRFSNTSVLSDSYEYTTYFKSKIIDFSTDDNLSEVIEKILTVCNSYNTSTGNKPIFGIERKSSYDVEPTLIDGKVIAKPCVHSIMSYDSYRIPASQLDDMCGSTSSITTSSSGTWIIDGTDTNIAVVSGNDPYPYDLTGTWWIVVNGNPHDTGIYVKLKNYVTNGAVKSTKLSFTMEDILAAFNGMYLDATTFSGVTSDKVSETHKKCSTGLIKYILNADKTGPYTGQYVSGVPYISGLYLNASGLFNIASGVMTSSDKTNGGRKFYSQTSDTFLTGYIPLDDLYQTAMLIDKDSDTDVMKTSTIQDLVTEIEQEDYSSNDSDYLRRIHDYDEYTLNIERDFNTAVVNKSLELIDPDSIVEKTNSYIYSTESGEQQKSLSNIDDVADKLSSLVSKMVDSVDNVYSTSSSETAKFSFYADDYNKVHKTKIENAMEDSSVYEYSFKKNKYIFTDDDDINSKIFMDAFIKHINGGE